MRGLLEKDLCILKQRKTAILLFFIIMVAISSTMESTFAICYGSMLFGFLPQGTIAYDEDGNCFTFLMTLPVTVRDYVTEKFLLCGGGLLFGWGVSMGLSFVTGAFGRSDAEAGAMVITLLVFAAIQGLYIPVQLKFGAEKSRYVIIGVGGGFLAVGMLLSRLLIPTADLLRVLTEAPESVVLLSMLVMSVAVLTFSYLWSVRIVEKRLF